VVFIADGAIPDMIREKLGIAQMVCLFENRVPSGKLLHNYGKSPFLMGQLTINGHFQ